MSGKLYIKKWLKIFIGLELAYVVIAAIVLNVGLISRLINTNPAELKIEYSFALSPFPAMAYIRNASFRIQDSNVQLFGKLNNTFLVLSIPALFHRQFETSRLDGGNLKFLFRLRRKPGVLRKIKLEALPSIPGLPDLSKPEKKKKAAEPSDDSKQWRIRLNHVHIAKISEIWFDRYHFLGDASVEGGFYLKPSHAVEVFPAVLTINSGSLVGDNEASLEGISGEIHTELQRINTTDGEEDDIAPRLSGAVALHAKVKGIEAANAYLQGVKWLRLSGGEGKTEIDVHIKDGKLIPESSIEIFSKGITADIWRQRAVGDGYVHWRLVDGKSPRGVLELVLDRYTLGPSGDKGPALIKGKNLSVVLEGQGSGIEDSLKNPRAHVVIPHAEIEDLTYLNGFLPKGPGLTLVAGHGTLDANLSIGGDKDDSGTIVIDAPQWKAKIADHLIDGRMLIEIDVKGGSIENSRVKVKQAKLDFKAVALNDGQKDWWATARILDAAFEWKDEIRLAGKVDLKAKNASLLTTLYLTGKGKPLPGLVGSLLEFPDFQLAAQVKLGPEGFAVRYLEADSAHSRLRGWMSKRGKQSHAMALVEVGPLAAALEVNEAETRVIINDAQKWYLAHSPSGLAQYMD